jgi:hypothetical protein
MRQLTVKYEGQCTACGNDLNIGDSAMYERKTGIFCIGCEPVDPEDIRKYRQEKADLKAAKYEEWADKRRTEANATLNRTDRFTGDIAFNTQPGHIPLRARIIRQQDKAFESLRIAQKMEKKAALLRDVRVKGDAERKRQSQRDFVRSKIKVGMEVDTAHYGRGIVEKINQKTARISKTGASGNFTTTVDLSFICPYVKEDSHA